MSHSKWKSADPSEASTEAEHVFRANRLRSGGQAVNLNFSNDGFGQSKSEMYLQNKQPQEGNLNSRTINSLSSERQDIIHRMAESEPSNPRANLGNGYAIKEKPLVKQANLGGGSVTANLTGSGTTTHMAPDLYSPLFLTQNLMLPRDRITANAWNRAFYETNPIVRNCINLHATYPISKLNIKCHDKKKEQFFLDQAEKVDLISVVQDVALEWWKLGECFVYSSFDERTGMWDKIYTHNPDYISVRASAIPGVETILLKADPELEKIVTGSDPSYNRIREQLDERVINHVIKGEAIPLDSFNISHLKHLSSPYDIRGTSIIVSCWKDLMLYDKLRETKVVQADSMINPLTLIKVGSSNPDGQYPREEDLRAWREIFERAQYDKDFKIVTHPDVMVERNGFSGALVDVQNDFNMIIDNIMMGMMVPKSVVTQEGASYASASVGLDVMRQRYNNFRNMLANWLIKKIFAPIAEANDFYSYESGKKKLIVPEIEWNQMTLFDLDTYIGHLMTMHNTENREVSRRTIFRSLGLSVKDEEANIREESIADAIMQKEKAVLAEMSISELRALDPEKPISEPVSEDDAEGLAGAPGGPGGLPLEDMGPPMGGGGFSDMGPPGPSLDVSPPGAEMLGGPPTGGPDTI